MVLPSVASSQMALETGSVWLPPEFERAAIDRGRPLIGAVIREGQDTGSVLGHATGAADGTVRRTGGGAIEDQRAIIDNRPIANRAVRTAVADLERAAEDGRRPGVGIVSRENLRAGAQLRQNQPVADAIRDDAGEGTVIVGIANPHSGLTQRSREVRHHDTRSIERTHGKITGCAVRPSEAMIQQLHSTVEGNVGVLQADGISTDTDAASHKRKWCWRCHSR
jgi:hypothetical protein